MKYYIINGSPRKGNTWRVAQLIKGYIRVFDAEAAFEETQLKDSALPFCSGCSSCFRLGESKCPHYNDMKPIIDRINRNDALILSFTTYNMAPNALTKNFIDHLCYMLHRPAFFSKKALAITTTGGVGGRKAVKYVAGTLKGIGFNRCYKLPITAKSWNDYNPDRKILKKCYGMARKFQEDVKSRKLKAPLFTDLMIYNLFRGMSKAYSPGSQYPTADGIHWTSKERAKGVYDKSVKTPFYKKPFGALFYGIGILGSKFITVTYKKAA